MEPDELVKTINQCQNGSPAAFTWLLRHFGPRLFGYFFRATGSRTDAEDLLQDIFVKLIENIGGYRHQGRFEHWLLHIAANMVRDRGRKRIRRAPVFSLDHLADPENSPWAADIDANEPTPLMKLENDERLDQLQHALKQLSQTDREIIMLRHYSQMSFKEIAQIYDMPVGTVLAKVHRGLKRLKGIMTENE